MPIDPGSMPGAQQLPNLSVNPSLLPGPPKSFLDSQQQVANVRNLQAQQRLQAQELAAKNAALPGQLQLQQQSLQQGAQGLQSGAVDLKQKQMLLRDQDIIRQFYMNGTAAPATAAPAAAPTSAAAPASPIVQYSPSSGGYRNSSDGGQTWQPGQPANPQQ